jgi:hypothetical protein
MKAKNEALKSETVDRTQRDGNQTPYHVEDVKQYTNRGRYA